MKIINKTNKSDDSPDAATGSLSVTENFRQCSTANFVRPVSGRFSVKAGLWSHGRLNPAGHEWHRESDFRGHGSTNCTGSRADRFNFIVVFFAVNLRREAELT